MRRRRRRRRRKRRRKERRDLRTQLKSKPEKMIFLSLAVQGNVGKKVHHCRHLIAEEGRERRHRTGRRLSLHMAGTAEEVLTSSMTAEAGHTQSDVSI